MSDPPPEGDGATSDPPPEEDAATSDPPPEEDGATSDPPPEGDGALSDPRREARTVRVRWVIVVGIGAAGVGVLVGRCFPPFVLDSPFWREFWTGPPAAGLFAVLGAFVAFGAAWFTSSTTREAAQRDEWWDRAEWALNLAMSDNGSDRDVGLAAIEVILKEATDTEADMVNEVTSILLDAPTGPAKGISSFRCGRWLRRRAQ